MPQQGTKIEENDFSADKNRHQNHVNSSTSSHLVYFNIAYGCDITSANYCILQQSTIFAYYQLFYWNRF